MAKTTIPAGYIAANAITSTELAANSVTAAAIASGAILSIDIGANSVSSTAIAANAVDSSEIASNAVGTSQIAGDAVTAAKIADNAVGSDQIAANAVGSSELASGALSGQNFTGDVTFDTDVLVVDSVNNRVGIGGTPVAGAKLQSQGALFVNGVISTAPSSPTLAIDYASGGARFISYDHLTNDPKIYFITSSSTSTDDRMVITSSGNVGIGNTSPLGKLTISNAAGANAPETITAANTYLQLGSDDYGLNGNGKFMIGFGYTDATNTNSPAYIGFEEETSSGDTAGQLTFYTRGVTTDTAPTQRMVIGGTGKVQIWHGGTTYYTSFEENNEINTYTAAGANSTMYLNHNGGDVNLRNGAMVVKDNGDITIGNTTISPASGFSDQRGFGYDNSTGYTEIAATAAGAPLEIGTNNASGSAILNLRKQGTVVGGISTFDGEVHFGRNTAGIMPIGSATTPRVVPTNFSSGTLSDNTVNLGNTDARWKDFYMAGDMNVGSQTSNVVPSNRKAWFQGGGSYFTSYSAGQSTITSDASGLIVGTPSTRPGTANYYTAGISFDHLLNYSTTGNITYNTYPHAWIGLKTYDFPGYERSSLVLATRSGVDSTSQTNDQLVISPHGEITMPNQPSFSVYISGTNPTLSSPSKIPYDAEEWDTNSDFDTTNNRFVAPVAGKYQFNIIYNVYGVSVGEWFRTLIAVNGSYTQYAAYVYSDSGSDQTICTPFMASLSAGDYVEVFHSSSDNSVGISSTTAWNKFQGFLIG